MALPHRTHLETLEKQLSNECTPVERARAAVQLLDALVRMQQVPGHALDALRLFFARDCSCCCTAPSFFPMIWARVVALKNSQLCSAAGEALFGICVGLHSNPVHVRILALKTLALFLRNAKPILPFTFLSWLNQQAKRTDLLSCSVGMFAVLFLMLGLESYDGAQAILSACLSKCTSNDELFLISCIAVRMLAAGISLVPFETWFDLVQDSFLNYTIDSISSSLLNDLKNLESLVILDEAPELSSGLALMFARERIPESLKTQIHHAFWSCCLTQFFVSRKIYFEFQKQAVPAAWKKFWGTLFYSVIRFLGMTSLDRFVLASPQILALRLDCVSLLQVGRSRHKQYSVVLTEFARRSETAVAMIELYLSSFSRLSVPDYVEKRLQTMIGSDLRVLKETALGSFDFPFLSREFFLLGLYTLWVNGQDLKPTLLKGPIRELSLITIVSDSKTTQRRSHGLYQALVRRDFGLVEDSVPFFIQACLESIPGRLDFRNFAKSFAAIVQSFPKGDRLLLFALDRIKQWLIDYNARVEAPHKEMSLLLFHSIQWIDVGFVQDALALIEEVFRSSHSTQQLALAQMMHLVLTNNFDIAIKDFCLRWFLQLGNSLGLYQKLLDTNPFEEEDKVVSDAALDDITRQRSNL